MAKRAMTKRRAKRQLLHEKKKSQAVAIILAILLGPIGFLYTSVLAGIILTVIALLTASTQAIPLLIWFICIIAAPFEIHSQNRKIEAEVELMAGPDREEDEAGARVQCPYCAEMIRAEAVVCRYCGRELTMTEEDIGDVAQALRNQPGRGEH